MNDYEISVVYAYHDSENGCPEQFPEQIFPEDKIQWLPVFDGDIFHPRKNALEKLKEAEGRYTILLDEGDRFGKALFEKMTRRLAQTDALFAVPSFVFPRVKRKPEYFSAYTNKLFIYDLTPRTYDDEDSESDDEEGFWEETDVLGTPVINVLHDGVEKDGASEDETSEDSEDVPYIPVRSGYPCVIPTELHGLLIRTDALQEALSVTLHLPEPEKQTLLYLLHKKPKFLYLGPCQIRYSYPRECDYQYDFRCMSREWYYEPFEKFLLPALEKEEQENGRAGKYLQCLALYMMHIRIFANTNNRNKNMISVDEVPAYSAMYSKVMQYVGVKTILSQKCNTSHCGLDNRLLDLQLKKQDFSYRFDLILSRKAWLRAMHENMADEEYGAEDDELDSLTDDEHPDAADGGLDISEDADAEADYDTGISEDDGTDAGTGGADEAAPDEAAPGRKKKKKKKKIKPFLACEGRKVAEMSVIPLRINLIDYKDGCLEIDGGVKDYFYDTDATITASFAGEEYQLTYNRRYSMTKCFGVSYARLKTFHVSIPLPPPGKEQILRFMLNVQGRSYQMDYEFPSHTSRFSRDFSYMLWQFGGYASFWNKAGIHIRKATAPVVLYKQLRVWLQMWKVRKGHRRQIPLKMLNFLLRPYFSRQKIWLFFDKIYKGGDSSEYIYRYAAAQNDGIKKYYLLDKSSADYARLRKEGYRPLKRGTLKHRLIFLNANMVIASNSTVFAFNDYNSTSVAPFRGDVHFDVACVQHGMSIQKIALAQQRLRDNTKLYFCASKYEIENLSKPVYDYIGYDALKLTGVPRYDGLKSRAQKIILLSPTWRMNSARPVTKNEGVARDYNPNFKETSYYKVYNSLINDPRLLSAAKQYGYRIQYVLHPIVSPQYDDFTQNDSVEIISAIGDMSYEKLFCEAALMVTDFSGVQFDFAYMRKPVVYLHHNDIPQHYEEGTYHYATMSFGEICHTNDELIDVLCRYMKNDCVMPEMYRKRADDFFAFSDNHNCERIYPIMLEHEMQRTR